MHYCHLIIWLCLHCPNNIFYIHKIPLKIMHCFELSLDSSLMGKNSLVFPLTSRPHSVQFSSVAQSSLILYNPMNRSTPGLPVHHQLPESTQTHVHWVGGTIQPSHPLSSPSPPALNLSQHQGLFQWLSSSHQVAEYWSFSFNISPSNEHPGLISFRMDWLDLLAVQGTLKSLLQHHIQKHQLFGAQLSL